MRNAWIPQPWERRASLLIPEYSGINTGQRVPDRSKTAHRKPLIKCFLTDIMVIWIKFANSSPFYSLMPKMSMFILAIAVWPLHGPNIPGSYIILFFLVSYVYFHHQSYPQLGIIFALGISRHSFWSYFSTLRQ